MIISILPSDKKGKKWMAKVDETGQTIYFGQAGAEDFTTHKDELKRKRWIARHKVEPWKPEVNLTPAWLSRYLLWEKDDMNKALAAASVMYPDIRFRWGSTRVTPKAPPPPPPPPKAPSPARESPARESPAREDEIRAKEREIRELQAELARVAVVLDGHIMNNRRAGAHEATELMNYIQRKITRRQRELDALRRR
jgi:hypothetical protein